MKPVTLLVALLAGTAVASPLQKRQDADDLDDIINAYEAVPDVTPTGPPLAVNSSQSSPTGYNQDAAIASSTPAAIANLNRRDGCTVNVVSNYAGTVSPDTPTAFSNDPTIASIANSASPPPGYFLVSGYQNLNASAEAPSYLTFIQHDLSSYNVSQCAAKCNSISGCDSFVICKFICSDHYSRWG
jgi:hypothetical protein